MKFKFLSAVALLTCSTLVSADWVGSVNYSRFSDDIGSQSVDFGALAFTAGYRFELYEKVRLVPEVRIGLGIGGDTVTTDFAGDVQTDFEINDYFGVAVRGEYIFSDALYAYGIASYQNIELKADGVRAAGEPIPFGSISSSTSDLGLGAGVGWQINERNAVEASYENIDGSDLITLGYRINF